MSSKAVLRFSWEPNAFWNDCHILDTNRPSRSDIIEIGTPCRATISLRYISASFLVLSFSLIGRKCADFVSRSTITQIISWPFEVRGNLVMKSIEICSHFHTGISGCWSNPEGF
ncbi:hypothetical protein Hanom_Chr04g00336501 [Helianthus anomalus]